MLVSVLLVSGVRFRAEEVPTGTVSRSVPASEWMVSVSWLAPRLKDPKILVVDSRTQEEYAKGHIPGAVHLNLNDLAFRSSDTGLTSTHEKLAAAFSLLGLSGEETVVFYDDTTELRAPRTLWLLSYAGYARAKMLFGGLHAWQSAGQSVTANAARRSPAPFVVEAKPAILATTEYVARRVRDLSTIILDVRSLEEYQGRNGSSHCARNGRIPGAVWLKWTELLDERLTYKEIDELQKQLFGAGITPAKEIIVYSHNGSRSANTFYALQLLGFPRVRHYAGSWHEWASRLDLPVERTEPQQDVR
ncbi:MAG: sulfurtransferase [Acidobacteriota bacterium]